MIIHCNMTFYWNEYLVYNVPVNCHSNLCSSVLLLAPGVFFNFPHIIHYNFFVITFQVFKYLLCIYFIVILLSKTQTFNIKI